MVSHMAVGFHNSASLKLNLALWVSKDCWEEHPQLWFIVRWHENSPYENPNSLFLQYHIQ